MRLVSRTTLLCIIFKNTHDLHLSYVKKRKKNFHFKIEKPIKAHTETTTTTTTTTTSTTPTTTTPLTTTTTAHISSLTNQSKPGSSCKSIKEQFGNSAPSGLYWIDLSPATQVYCDMDTDGGL